MLAKRYEAAMVLAGVGDALGYRNGHWEFCYDGQQIHEDAKSLGGISNISVSAPEWIVSDDTVMHLATAEALIETCSGSLEEQLAAIARKYIACMNDMDGRAPGKTCMASLKAIARKTGEAFWHLPFNSRAMGCGAAMRAMCIGLRYPAPSQLDQLIAVAIESGRITHHQPTGYLGSLVAALFTAYAVQGKPVKEWASCMADEILPLAKTYIEVQGRFVAENLAAWNYFESSWRKYIDLRQLRPDQNGPIFPKKYGVHDRDQFYTSISFRRWGGCGGHDSVIIAYDGLLGCNGKWLELCERATLHGGDNDSTGSIASCWFGALYGYDGVPLCHHQGVEYRDRMVQCGQELYRLCQKKKNC